MKNKVYAYGHRNKFFNKCYKFFNKKNNNFLSLESSLYTAFSEEDI